MSLLRCKVLTNLVRINARFVRFNHENVKPFHEIPGPSRYPIMGVLPHNYVSRYDLRDLPRTYLSLYESYGDLVKESSFDHVIVHVFNPEDIKEVYASDGQYPRRRSHTAIGKYRSERPQLYNSAGLLPTNGEEWAEFRKKFKNTLLHTATILEVSAAIEQVVDDFIAAVPHHLDENEETDIMPLIYRWGLETISSISLNKRLDSFKPGGNPIAEELIKAAEDTHRAIYDIEVSPEEHHDVIYKDLEQSQDLMGSALNGYIDELLNSEGWVYKKCLVSKLLKAGVDRKDILTLIIDGFLAGIDSAAFALVFALYHLALNKPAQDKLRKEIIQSFPSKEDRFETIDTRKAYLHAVFNETLRLNPIAVGNGRVLNSDLVLSGYHVPADTMVILQHEVAMKNEKNYKNALSFIPERWLEKDRGKAPAFKPFGNGTRTCIGVMLADKEVKLTLAKFIRNYEISYHHEPVGSTTMLLNFPDRPVRLRIKKVEN